MELLVLGGTGFVGRAVVEEALAAGHRVTTLNRGRRAADRASASLEAVTGDRTQPGGLDGLRGRSWDAVIDTWSGAPSVVRDSAALLADAAGHYGYVSSGSVYAPPVPEGVTEDAAVLEASPDDADGEYGANKAGAERAVTASFGERALLARAGLILGPYEDVGRLPWWLGRAARGGPMLAPEPRDLTLQYIDARDLAIWMLGAAERRLGGPVNLVCAPGHATMEQFLRACVEATGGAADLRWTSAETILAAGIEPWNDLPVWIPPGHPYRELLPGRSVDKALATGLTCRPLEETVADTWSWLTSVGGTAPQRADRPSVGLDADREAALLAG